MGKHMTHRQPVTEKNYKGSDWEEFAKLLPNVGDVVQRVPSYRRALLEDRHKTKGLLRRGEVVEVNRPHLWYRVRFEDTGLSECFKVPRLKGD